MSEGILTLEMEIAAYAERLKKNFLGEYFTSRRKDYIDELLKADPKDVEQVMKVKYRLDELERLEDDINSMIEGGKVAKATIATRETMN